jgi:hypothetical protein
MRCARAFKVQVGRQAPPRESEWTERLAARPHMVRDRAARGSEGRVEPLQLPCRADGPRQHAFSTLRAGVARLVGASAGSSTRRRPGAVDAAAKGAAASARSRPAGRSEQERSGYTSNSATTVAVSLAGSNSPAPASSTILTATRSAAGADLAPLSRKRVRAFLKALCIASTCSGRNEGATGITVPLLCRRCASPRDESPS